MTHPAFQTSATISFPLDTKPFLGTVTGKRCQLQPIKSKVQNRTTPTMLRVRAKRRPEDWDKKLSTLSGRFLPLDPREEHIINILENGNSRFAPNEDTYGPEGPPSEAYGESGAPTQSKKWSKRSEAAKKRWADLTYRAKMLEKREEKRRLDAEAAGEQPKHKIEIGCMDSITLCNDDKAKAINDYARSNKLRSEKVTAYHRDRNLWMQNRLSAGTHKLSDEEYIKMKKEKQQKRREIALKRAQKKREKEAMQQQQQKDE